MLGTATGQEVELHAGLRYWPRGELNTNQIYQAAENYRTISQCLKERKRLSGVAITCLGDTSLGL